jgi:hypothetical protein
VYVGGGDSLRKAQGPHGWANAKLRTHALRLLDRAGLPAWEKLFQNLRASRETEIARDYGIKEAAAWLGNSVEIAAKRYLRISEANRAAAVGKAAGSALQNPVHDALQKAAAAKREEPPTVLQPSTALGVTRKIAATYKTLQSCGMEDRGLEPLTS